jgi:uncharacterized protein YkwD
MVLVPVGAGSAGVLEPAAAVAACTPHKSGTVTAVKVHVAKATATAPRLRIVKPAGEESTVKVRVQVTVAANGRATGVGAADACPGGASNPQTVSQTIVWSGEKTATATRTATASTVRKARNRAASAALRSARADAVDAARTTVVRRAKEAATGLAWAASIGGSTTEVPIPATLERFGQVLSAEVTRLTNRARTTEGTPPLATLGPLGALARRYAQAAADSHVLADFGSTEEWSHSPVTMARDVPGLEVCSGNDGAIGENFGVWVPTTLTDESARTIAVQLQQAWMEALGSRLFLLAPWWTRVGVGVGYKPVASDRAGVVVMVELYSGSCPEIPG